MTRYLSADQKAEKIADVLMTHGPMMKGRLLRLTKLTEGQFANGWRHLKREWAGGMDAVAVWDPLTWEYGMWIAEDESAWAGTLNRVGDSLSRLLTIERGQLDGLRAQGLISKRLHRALVMAREEYEDQVDRFRAAADGQLVS